MTDRDADRKNWTGIRERGKGDKKKMTIITDLASTQDKELKKTDKDHTADAVGEGIASQETPVQYPDFTRKTDESDKRSRFPKNRLKIILACAAALILLLTCSFLPDLIKANDISKQIEGIRVQAETGHTSQALAALEELDEQGELPPRYYSQLYTVTDTILKKTAEEDGFEAAFSLYQDLEKSVPYSLEEEEFRAYALSMLKNEDLPVTERWLVFQTMKTWKGNTMIEGFSEEDGMNLLKAYIDTADSHAAWDAVFQACQNETVNVPPEMLAECYQAHVDGLTAEEAWEELRTLSKEEVFTLLPQDTLTELEGKILDQIAGELRNNTGRDMTSWLESNSDLLGRIKADPNSALRFIYEMTRTGYDIFDILPDGIPLQISAS